MDNTKKGNKNFKTKVENNNDTSIIIKKKRGRKPKAKYENNNSQLQNSNNDNVSQPKITIIKKSPYPYKFDGKALYVKTYKNGETLAKIKLPPIYAKLG